VIELIRERLPNSLSSPSSPWASRSPWPSPGRDGRGEKGTGIDRGGQVIAVLGQSLPTFWLAIILVEFVSGRLRWLPAAGMTRGSSAILPGFTLGWFVVAGLMRLRARACSRCSTRLRQAGARQGCRGAPRGLAARPQECADSRRAFAGIYFAILVTTAIVVETVFAWPGLGRLAYEGISSRELPVIRQWC
jgi:peptide/nickel transport system permease protein